jgi:excisionase family DNA binding protein
MTGQLLTAEQLAERWQVKPSHVYRLTREGQIPAVRLGRYYRYRLDAIEAVEIGADRVGDNEHRAAGARLASPPARPTGA